MLSTPMPTKSPRSPAHAASSQTGTGTASATKLAEPSNAEQAELIRTEEGTADGLSNYQASLGQWLGAELYGAISPHLTLEAIGGHANEGLASAMRGLVGMLENIDGDVSEDDLDQFGDALVEQYDTIASDWLKSDGAKVTTALTDWIDAHPKTVVVTALLAAAGAIMANAKIPELTKRFNLSENASLKLQAKLGRLRNITLEQISAKLSWTSGPLVAAMTVKHADGSTSTESEVTVGDDERHITAHATTQGDDLILAGVGGLVKISDKRTLTGGYEHSDKDGNTSDKIVAEITDVDGNLTRIHGVDYDVQTGVVTIKEAFTQKSEGGEASFSSSTGSDGTQTQKIDLSRSLGAGLTATGSLENLLKREGLGSAYELSSEQKASIGLDYSVSDLDAAMDLSLSSSGTNSIGGSLSKTWDEKWSAGGDFTKDWGNKDALQVGAFFGYRDPDKFRTYLAKYRYNHGDSTTQEIDLLLEEKVGAIYGRLQQRIGFTATGTALETTVQGAYFINDDFALIGGARYQRNDRGDHSLAPQLGMQVGDIPLILTHDPSSGTTTIGITFKFGR